MSYVVFENAGEIDPISIQTFGVSVKETDHPIGFFGTGLKYALAILLRTGHRVILQAGSGQHEFTLTERTIRNTPFRLVHMDETPLGFTDQLGKTWEVWMAYRELYCNTKDESGAVDLADEIPAPTEGITRFIVEGDEFLTQHNNRGIFLLEGEPFLKLDGVDVHKGEACGAFYRGILVHRFPKGKSSMFTYNFTRPIDLTEDRTAKYASFLPMYLATDFLECVDQDFLKRILVAEEKHFEHEINFKDPWGPAKPAAAFNNTVACLVTDRAARTNFSAIRRYKEAQRAELTPATTILRGVEAEMLERAIAFCKGLSFLVDEYEMIVTDTLGAGVFGCAEGGRIYIARHAFQNGTKMVAATLIEEFIHLKHGYDDESREMQTFLLTRLVSVGEELGGEPL
jgi:hypothetical protein